MRILIVSLCSLALVGMACGAEKQEKRSQSTEPVGEPLVKKLRQQLTRFKTIETGKPPQQQVTMPRRTRGTKVQLQ